MGEQVRKRYVSFEPRGMHFIAFVPIDAVESQERDLEVLLRDAEVRYRDHLSAMRCQVGKIAERRKRRLPVLARTMWALGDQAFQLVRSLSSVGLELDGLYDHLSRDLGVKRKWLEKVIIFRRYIAAVDFIPESLSWGKCERGTRGVAERIMRGESIG